MPVMNHEETERARAEGRCPRCGGSGLQESRSHGEWVEECVGCWLDKREFLAWVPEDGGVPGPEPYGVGLV
jgi:hypothetical protein